MWIWLVNLKYLTQKGLTPTSLSTTLLLWEISFPLHTLGLWWSSWCSLAPDYWPSTCPHHQLWPRLELFIIVASHNSSQIITFRFIAGHVVNGQWSYHNNYCVPGCQRHLIINYYLSFVTDPTSLYVASSNCVQLAPRLKSSYKSKLTFIRADRYSRDGQDLVQTQIQYA